MSNNAIELNNAKDFVTISKKYHGGNQQWYDSSKFAYKYGQLGGCGSVVMADMITYLSIENPREYSCLIPFKSVAVDKREYLLFMENIYRFCKPLPNPISFLIKGMKKTLGVPFPGMMKAGIKRYALKAEGIKLRTRTLSNASFSRSVSFIRESLRNNCPVGMVIWGNKKMKSYEYHWMTITKLIENDSAGETLVTVATWGGFHELCLEDLYFSPNKFKWFGLIAFDIKKTSKSI